MKNKTTFEGLLRSFEPRYDLREVFDDFLTMTLAGFSYNPAIGKSYDEHRYMEAAARYTKEEVRTLFPHMLACLTLEMEDRRKSSEGNDVLGSFYEQHLYRKGASQYFTPWPVCCFMANITEKPATTDGGPLRILDSCCGSGRMLLAAAKANGPRHEYYGIDIDQVCVKMTAINLFMNGIFHSEVMCADALRPDDFRESYRTSFLPYGIFRIAEKENSRLWHLHVNSFQKSEPASDAIAFEDRSGQKTATAIQLKLL